jgi:Leucine-rich repeat (LRR) protein
MPHYPVLDPFLNYDDSILVRAILDSNGLYDLEVDSVVQRVLARGAGVIKINNTNIDTFIITKDFSDLNRLLELDLQSNSLKNIIIRDSIHALELIRIIISDNHIKKFGDFFKLPNVKYIYASNNIIDSLPSDSLLLTLDSLDIRNNYLCDVDSSTQIILNNFDAEWNTHQTCTTGVNYVHKNQNSF